jgi:Pyruvate/2-oxoacid:ferredoxin oxidoreductase gamma subunit
VELEKPFEHAEKIIELSGELEKINTELDLDKSEIEPVIDDTKFKDEVKLAETDEDESGGETGVNADYRPENEREYDSYAM